ncbi:hypothetical protein ACIRU3_37955 [Streptomyces sp. NPDC101151]|uniref:hypothetical protein n=1 Tax=Streptomyces sp. NPDC101151 TaxID=3366115 RepID=UPI0037FB814E
MQDAKGVTRYGVHVRCGIPGARPGRETRTSPAGVLSGTLTRGTSARDHEKYLLRSAG